FHVLLDVFLFLRRGGGLPPAATGRLPLGHLCGGGHPVAYLGQVLGGDLGRPVFRIPAQHTGGDADDVDDLLAHFRSPFEFVAYSVGRTIRYPVGGCPWIVKPWRAAIAATVGWDTPAAAAICRSGNRARTASTIAASHSAVAVCLALVAAATRASGSGALTPRPPRAGHRWWSTGRARSGRPAAPRRRRCRPADPRRPPRGRRRRRPRDGPCRPAAPPRCSSRNSRGRRPATLHRRRKGTPRPGR